jgi:hypothetical protein
VARPVGRNSVVDLSWNLVVAAPPPDADHGELRAVRVVELLESIGGEEALEY